MRNLILISLFFLSISSCQNECNNGIESIITKDSFQIKSNFVTGHHLGQEIDSLEEQNIFYKYSGGVDTLLIYDHLKDEELIQIVPRIGFVKHGHATYRHINYSRAGNYIEGKREGRWVYTDIKHGNTTVYHLKNDEFHGDYLQLNSQNDTLEYGTYYKGHKIGMWKEKSWKRGISLEVGKYELTTPNPEKLVKSTLKITGNRNNTDTIKEYSDGFQLTSIKIGTWIFIDKNGIEVSTKEYLKQ